jgi:hypothetical protein
MASRKTVLTGAPNNVSLKKRDMDRLIQSRENPPAASASLLAFVKAGHETLGLLKKS